MKQLEARTLKGFRDLLPSEALLRKQILNIITEVYESFGFSPLETPALEYADVLTGKYGEEGEMLMYRFRDNGDREVAMRYDLTVPLARVVAQYQDIPKPFRRYQIAPVWRAENTQKGRYREFIQCDVDIVGSKSLVADAEIAQIAAAVLQKLEVGNFTIRLNNRKVLNGILEISEIPEDKWIVTLRIIDKWDKIGADGVKAQLATQLTNKQIANLFAILPKEGEEFAKWGSRNGQTLIKSPVGREGWLELNKVIELLKAGTSDASVFVGDVLLARGLDYYTGTIIEAALTDAPQFGSVFGGGRYDKLIGMFSKEDVPAVGISAGVDRIMAAMIELKKLTPVASTARVLVTQLDAALQGEYMNLASTLRNAGIPTELYPEAVKLEKQFKYAYKIGIPWAVVVGENELRDGNVTLKNIQTQEQSGVTLEELIQALGGGV